MRPRLSIVVPVYNGARTLPKTLERLQDQTMADWECLVVDDGSTDRSYNIARAFGELDPRIAAYSLMANFGAANAVNFGMRMAAGRYTMALAADDYLLEDAAEKFVRALDESPAAPGAYSDWINWYEADGIKDIHRAPDFSRDLLRRGDFINFSALVVRGPVWLDPDWNPVADWDYLLRLSRDRQLVHIREVLGVRRIHPAQVSVGLGGPGMMMKRLLLPYRYDTFPGATRTALKRLRDSVWEISRRRLYIPPRQYSTDVNAAKTFR